MRLRYFHIRHYPPLHDVEIVFSAQSPLNTINAIHFVVGVNGSGKTHLLQALTETFLCLEQKRAPKFGVTLVYELGKDKAQKQTYVFEHDAEQGIHWWQSNKGFTLPLESPAEHFQNILKHLHESPNSAWNALIINGNWPGSGSKTGLPEMLLAYTTGLANGWHDLFTAPVSVNSPDWGDEPEERPLGWTMGHELQRNINPLGQELPKIPLETKRAETEVCQFVTPFMLKLAVVAVTLNLARKELKEHRTDVQRKAFIQSIQEKTDSTGLRGLLSQVDWVWPVSLVIECHPSDDAIKQNDENNSASKFWKAYLETATTILPEQEPETKYRVIFDIDNRKKEQALVSLFDLNNSAFDIFQQMLNMHHDGMLDKISIALRKADTEDILLFDELSDGEQMFLGRMALFHLLEGQDDALLLLDEPETHFNDVWKREMVGIIDSAMQKQSNHVLISTHSSITLTDVFDDEIIRFTKENGDAEVMPITSTTFGADPSEIMISVFGAEDSIGERSLEWLNAQLEKEWKPDQREELERIIKQIGPGLHRSELRTIWRKLNAAQD